MSKIFITGLGIISPIGISSSDNRSSLIQGKCGIDQAEYVDSKYTDQLKFGEIKISDEQLKTKLNANTPEITRTTLLAFHAFEECINDGQLSKEELISTDTALICASTVGGMCLTDELYRDANKDSEGSAFLSSYDCASVGMHLQKKYGFKGIINTINTACSSSANAIMYGTRLIKHGWAKRAIVGGVDSLAKFTINGFNALHILSSDHCHPFDESRDGLNLGEGAAFLILERDDDIKNKKVYGAITGYANSNDAFHASSLSEEGDGPYEAMKHALNIANLSPDQINYINAHGTGTENNDEVEGKAMKRLFGAVPKFTSSKSNIGHTLGAAGAIESTYSILSLYHQEIYPGIHFNVPIPSTGLKPELTHHKTELNHVMSNSFGFGGNCSTLIFSKV